MFSGATECSAAKEEPYYAVDVFSIRLELTKTVCQVMRPPC